MVSFLFGLGAIGSLLVMVVCYSSKKRSHAKVQNAFLAFLGFLLAYLLASFWGTTLLPIVFGAQTAYGLVSVGLIGLGIIAGLVWVTYLLIRSAFGAVRYAVSQPQPIEPEPPEGS
jgi:hypothetical protein